MKKIDDISFELAKEVDKAGISLLDLSEKTGITYRKLKKILRPNPNYLKVHYLINICVCIDIDPLAYLGQFET